MTLAAGTRLGPYDPPSLPRGSYGVMHPPSLAFASEACRGPRAAGATGVLL
jgi:hypothetical protein